MQHDKHSFKQFFKILGYANARENVLNKIAEYVHIKNTFIIEVASYCEGRRATLTYGKTELYRYEVF